MHALVRNWWMVLLRGIAALLFGIIIAARPAAGLYALVLLFGVYAIVFGAFAIGGGIMYSPQRRAELVVEGIIALLAGIMTFAWPGITAVALYATIAGFAILTGILQIVGAARLRGEVDGAGWLIASGVISILFGVLLIAMPRAGALALAFIIAAYGIALGVTMIALSLKLRELLRRVPPPRVPTIGTPQPV